MITKSDELILKSFLNMKTPAAFDSGVENVILVDSVHGLVNRLLSKQEISIEDIKKSQPDMETKKKLSEMLSSSKDNQIYYTLIKLCFMILEKYSD